MGISARGRGREGDVRREDDRQQPGDRLTTEKRRGTGMRVNMHQVDTNEICAGKADARASATSIGRDVGSE